jgi:hypothetical protein
MSLALRRIIRIRLSGTPICSRKGSGKEPRSGAGGLRKGGGELR